MVGDATKGHAAIINSLSDILEPFHGPLGVINQPNEQQIIAIEQQPMAYDFATVEEYIYIGKDMRK